MWIVKTINRDNITDIVEYVQEISKINDKDITLSLNSSLGFAETFLYLYEQKVEHLFVSCILIIFFFSCFVNIKFF